MLVTLRWNSAIPAVPVGVLIMENASLEVHVNLVKIVMVHKRDVWVITSSAIDAAIIAPKDLYVDPVIVGILVMAHCKIAWIVAQVMFALQVLVDVQLQLSVPLLVSVRHVGLNAQIRVLVIDMLIISVQQELSVLQEKRDVILQKHYVNLVPPV